MQPREVIEALLFATHGALELGEILRVVPNLEVGDLEAIIADLNAIYDHSGRSFRIVPAARGYMFITRDAYAAYIKQLQPASRLSPAALEVLALIAYKGPSSKQSIDGIRGVDSGSALKSLLRHQIIDVRAGKPMRYVTTPRFLEVFGLNSLADLPDIGQFEEIFGQDRPVDEQEAAGVDGPDGAVAPPDGD